ncbi:fasciclin domain-containing protein [Thalassotalea sp. Y01]|uniref:fasciclin domain-containing protein n=1 Tax=Thalassotalea sp. Y01 TaxID=2729613 RepID=UPI001B7D5D1A|nr:fasciclin domain-containing protein [Thalassotalea sp. Y01]
MMNTVMSSLTKTIATLSVATFLSASAYAAKPKWAEKSDVSIVDFAVAASGEPFDFDSNGEDFDVLVAALIATGTVAAFDGSDLTVFAPNDNAFYMLTNTTNDADAFNAAVSLLGADGVADVLKYHVTEGVRNSRSVTRAKMVEMLDGNSIYYDDGLIIAEKSEAKIISEDNRLSDGMVHIIDTVLEP